MTGADLPVGAELPRIYRGRPVVARLIPCTSGPAWHLYDASTGRRLTFAGLTYDALRFETQDPRDQF